MFRMFFVLVLAITLTAAARPPFYENKQDLLYYQDHTGALMPVTTATHWEKRRAHVLANMQQVMGPLPGGDRTRPPDYEVLETVAYPAYVRKTIRYATESWDSTPAFLFIPNAVDARTPAPAMLCLHPTSALGKRVVSGEGERANRNYAVELVEQGYVALAPDYPGFGDYVETRKRLYEKGYVSATMKGIWNHLRAVDLLASMPEVDAQRIGCIGHSLGGHNTLFVSAFEPRIKVAITSCGFTPFSNYMAGNLTGWTHDGYMPRIASMYDKDPARMPFEFTEVLGVIAPRAIFISAPLADHNFNVEGVRDAVSAALPVYDLFHARDNLRVAYPDAAHDFPEETRKQAYAFLNAKFRNE